MGPGIFGQKGYNTYIEGFMKYLDSSFSMDTAKVLYKHHKAFKRAVKFINRATDLESESVPIFLARYFVLTL